MTEPNAFQLIHDLLQLYSNTVATDLAQCTHQTVRTTKHDRRERALAYLIENITGSTGTRFPNEQWAINYINLIDSILPRVGSAEARTGFERARARLQWAIDNPEEGFTKRRCEACGEVMDLKRGDCYGGGHVCTNRRAQMKDIVMGDDRDLPKE